MNLGGGAGIFCALLCGPSSSPILGGRGGLLDLTYNSYSYKNHFHNYFCFQIGSISECTRTYNFKIEIVNLSNLKLVRGFLLYINLAWVSVCLSVCLYPINVKTA